MILFYFFVLISLSYGLSTVSGVTKLSAPHLNSLTSIGSENNVGFVVNWDKVVSDDAADPVIGYKVNIWELKKIKSTKYAYVNGTLQQIEEEIEPPIDLNNVPEQTPTVILTPANETEVTYNNIKLQVTYEVRVQAYTKNIDGPLSTPFRIHLGN